MVRYVLIKNAPAVLALALWYYVPALQSFGLSLFDWDGVTSGKFVGLANYGEVLSDPVFWRSLGNMAIVLAFSLTVPFFAPFAAAELICGLRSTTGSSRPATWRPARPCSSPSPSRRGPSCGDSPLEGPRARAMKGKARGTEIFRFASGEGVSIGEALASEGSCAPDRARGPSRVARRVARPPASP